ncbi:POU domain class 2-associating factor 1 isoform X2 [Stegastes partitus]|uniref:POU class 2 homeobox associating factor 1 n=1 Tax=Stegastes partitus TaxID=144197 RepID=A0A3B5BHN3_9TELE|nr:PREDICTED: POU domain class 2-associating factor 1 isoform X2 [Stegastes partitus]
MHWEKSSPAAGGRSRPYQGVRVRDPVKELLRRKRSLELHSTKTASHTGDVVAHNNQSSYPTGIFCSDAASGSPAEPPAAAGDGGLQCSGWKAAPSVSSAGLQPAVMPWSPSDYNQQDPSAQTLAYPAAPTLTADVYMQTLCPSYTMLTYTHTPLLTNFGTIPVGPGPASLPQMELPDSGLTYLPWAQPLTTISTMPNPGVQFAPGSAALPGSPLVHMPLSMSLTTMFPQLEAQGADPQPQILDLPQHSDHQLDPEPQGQSLNEDPEVESESPNLLDKLLEDHKEHGEEEEKDSYSSSIFIPSV